MRVEYQAQGGATTERFRVDFPGDELAALADLANVITGEHDALGRALARAAREWKLDQEIQPPIFGDECKCRDDHTSWCEFYEQPGSADSVGTMARPTENAPASRERSGAEPSEVALDR